MEYFAGEAGLSIVSDTISGKGGLMVGELITQGKTLMF